MPVKLAGCIFGPPWGGVTQWHVGADLHGDGENEFVINHEVVKRSLIGPFVAFELGIDPNRTEAPQEG